MYLSDDEWEAKNKPKLPKVNKRTASEASLEVSAKSALAAAASANHATQLITESVIATQGTARALLDMVSKLSESAEGNNHEPQPVRLIVNRKNKLIESIDVIPLVRKK